MEFSGIVNSKAQLRGKGLHWFDPKGVTQVDRGERVVIEWIKGTKLWMLFDHLALFESAPIFVLAFQHAFERRGRQAHFMTEKGGEAGHREVPVADDGIHPTVERL